MTDPDAVINDLHSRVYSFRPAVNERVTALSADYMAVDFTLGFPDGNLVDIPRARMGNTGNSSVIIGPNGYIEEFTLRFPPLPADEYSRHDAAVAITKAVGTTDVDPSSLHIKAEPGGGGFAGFDESDVESWWPHVILQPPNYTEFDPESFMRFLRGTYRAYREEVK